MNRPFRSLLALAALVMSVACSAFASPPDATSVFPTARQAAPSAHEAAPVSVNAVSSGAVLQVDRMQAATVSTDSLMKTAQTECRDCRTAEHAGYSERQLHAGAKQGGGKSKGGGGKRPPKYIQAT